MVKGGGNLLAVEELLLAEEQHVLGDHRWVLRGRLSQREGLHSCLVSKEVMGDHVLCAVSVDILPENVLSKRITR